MKIAISGATGFIGTHLTRYLSGQGHEVTGLGRKFFWGSHGSCMAVSVILVFWVPELSIGLLFVWNCIYMLVAYERELRRRKKKEES